MLRYAMNQQHHHQTITARPMIFFPGKLGARSPNLHESTLRSRMESRDEAIRLHGAAAFEQEKFQKPGKAKKRAKVQELTSQDVMDVFGVEPPEREFTRDFFQPDTPENAEFLKATRKKDRDALAALVILRRAITTHSEELAQAAESLLGWRPPEWAIEEKLSTRHARKAAADLLYSALLNYGMKYARLEIRETAGGYVPAIICPGLRTAAFVFAAWEGVEVCPGCGRLFAPDPNKRAKYHSAPCGQRIRQQEYRKRGPVGLRKKRMQHKNSRGKRRK